MRKVAVVTVARSDFNIYLPLLRAINESTTLDLQLIVAGMHLEEAFGSTVQEILNMGFTPAARVPMDISCDTPVGVARSMGLGCERFGLCYNELHPDMVLVLGDRFEMHPAALAALPFRIPVGHIHGGELTFGAIDDALRHSITKLSHLHFASTEEYARRIIQLGEDPKRVFWTGGLAIDNIQTTPTFSLEEFNAEFNLSLEPGFLLTTFHPVTLEYEQTEYHIHELLAALIPLGRQILFTLPNADTAGTIVIKKITECVKKHEQAFLVGNLGSRGYYSAMKHAGAMVGNSSSGLLESAPFKIPVVNIGTRQDGRIRPENVVDVDYPREAILKGLEQALAPEFKRRLSNLKNPYSKDGAKSSAAKEIVDVLETVALGEDLIKKRFYDFKD